MNKKLIQNSIINLVFFLWIGVVGYGFFTVLPLSLQSQTGPAITNSSLAKTTLANSTQGLKYPATRFPDTGATQSDFADARQPGDIAHDLPVRLRIPSINVNSAIEDAYLTSDGRIDVQPGSVNVAWFSLGPYPGQVGNSVIGGHYGMVNSVPMVFYNLDKLRIGENIYIENESGDTLTFVVRSTEYFAQDANVTPVFTAQDGQAHLNLVTFAGVWNQVNGSYPDRLVVFSDAIPQDGTTATPMFPQTGDNTSLVPSTLFSSPIFRDLITPMDKVITSVLVFSIILVMVEIVRPIIGSVSKFRAKKRLERGQY